MAQNKNNFESLMDEALTNVRQDREKTNQLLGDLIAYVSKVNEDRHKEVGLTLAKYLETLQRSNEQLVKLTAIIKKDESGSSELSDEDREKIFNELNPSITKKKDKK